MRVVPPIMINTEKFEDFTQFIEYFLPLSFISLRFERNGFDDYFYKVLIAIIVAITFAHTHKKGKW